MDKNSLLKGKLDLDLKKRIIGSYMQQRIWHVSSWEEQAWGLCN